MQDFYHQLYDAEAMLRSRCDNAELFEGLHEGLRRAIVEP